MGIGWCRPYGAGTVLSHCTQPSRVGLNSGAPPALQAQSDSCGAKAAPRGKAKSARGRKAKRGPSTARPGARKPREGESPGRSGRDDRSEEKRRPFDCAPFVPQGEQDSQHKRDDRAAKKSGVKPPHSKKADCCVAKHPFQHQGNSRLRKQGKT
jgi:hypothetical protein